MNRDTYQLPLRYVYDVQFHRCIKMSPFSVEVMRTPPRPTTVVGNCTKLATDDDIALPLYARLKLIKHATDPAKRPKRNHDWCKNNTEKATTYSSISSPSFALRITFFSIVRLYSDELRSVPPQKGTISYYLETKGHRG